MRKLFRRNEFFLALLIVALGLGFTLANPKFATIGNLLDLVKSYSFFGILSVGVLVVLLSGGIDISFTAIAQVAEYASVALILQVGGNLWTAFLVACCVGIVLGTLNGLLIHFIRIPPIITTIGTLNLYYGVLYVLSAGQIIYQVPDFYRALSGATLPGNFPVLGALMDWSSYSDCLDPEIHRSWPKYLCARRERNSRDQSGIQYLEDPTFRLFVYGFCRRIRCGRAYSVGAVRDS